MEEVRHLTPLPFIFEDRKRTHQIPKRYEDFEVYRAYCLITSENDTVTYKEAIDAGNDWKEAINAEFAANKKFNTWTVTNLPKDNKAIDTKGVFRTKSDGIKQARLPTVRMTMSHAVQNDWNLRHLDIPSAFLNETLN